MDNTKIIVGYLEEILGSSKPTSGYNFSFKCPFCKHSKNKLEVCVNLKENRTPWHCWHCDKRGKSLSSLLRSVNTPIEIQIQIQKYVQIRDFDKLLSIGTLSVRSNERIKLPKEYQSLTDNIERGVGSRALRYLKSRKITGYDILKYEIGYCSTGLYRNHLIIPSYDREGNLNYFVARNLDTLGYRKYNNPKLEKNIVPFESTINWKLPIVLCEGVFDAIAIKKNVIPLLGSSITSTVMKTILQNNVREVYLVLDRDKYKKALEYSKTLIQYGIKVYLIKLEGKDPSDLGFKRITKLLNSAEPLTLHDLFVESMNN